MKSILLYVSDDDAMEGRLQAAIGLTRAFGSHLTCLQVTPIDMLISGDFYGGLYATGDLVEQMHERARQHRVALEQQLRREEVSWDWHAVTLDPAFALIEQAALCDLVVLGLPQDTGKSRALVSDVAVTVRAPVLVMPAACREFDCSGAAFVAWNGSVEAAHALRSALPLLARASSVRIVTVTDDDVRLPGKAAANYLALHGVSAEICDWQRGTGRIADVLLDDARAVGGAYLVAGAYGHTRFREAILGGVTRELLERASLPLLLSH